MKKQWLIAIGALLLAPHASVIAADTTKETAGNEAAKELARIVTCEKNATPEQVINLLKKAGGKKQDAEQPNDDIGGVIYQLTTPIMVWGHPSLQFTLDNAAEDEGIVDIYSAVLQEDKNLSIKQLAEQGQVPQISDNNYVKEAADNTLFISSDNQQLTVSCSHYRVGNE